MTQVIVPKGTKPSKLKAGNGKPIKAVGLLALNFCWVMDDPDLREYEYVQLIRERSPVHSQLDVFMAWDKGRNPTIFRGHWNDGYVEKSDE